VVLGDDKGLTLFCVYTNATGIARNTVRLVDSAVAAHVEFDGVVVDADAVIGEVDEGDAVLKRMLNAGRAGSAAEILGVGAGSMDITLDYVKGRQQFDKIIATFQALQHRISHLYSEMEIARAVVLKAQQMLDEDSAKAEMMVSVAKAKAGRTTALSVKEGVQMHGGVGMTDAYDMGFYMKRARVGAEWLGDYSYHAEKVAALRGF